MDPGLDSNADWNSFAQMCGQVAAIRLQVVDARSGASRVVEIPSPVAIVGSGEDCEICLPHPEVSRRHAYFQVIDGRLACCDLDSRNGVHWDKKTRPRGWLAPGETLHIGPYLLTLLGPVGDQSVVPDAVLKFSVWDAPGESTVPLVLTFLNAHSRSGTKRICRMVRRITLAGWSDLCNLRLQHSSVDRVHCSLIALHNELWLVDLKSDQGVSVNGQPVHLSRLQLGDQLRLGKFHLSVRTNESLADDSTAMPPHSSAYDDSETLPGGELRPPMGSTSGDSRRRSGGLVPRGGLRPLGPGQGLVPAARPSADVSDPGSSALMAHFQTMQAQMLEHQQQMMAMVVQAFSSAQTRQLDVIREELQRVHELNRELQELQARREGSEVVGPGYPAPPPAAPQPGAPAPAATPAGGFPPGMFPPGGFPQYGTVPGMFPGMFPGMGIPGMGGPGPNPMGPPPMAPRVPLPKASSRPPIEPRGPRPTPGTTTANPLGSPTGTPISPAATGPGGAPGSTAPGFTPQPHQAPLGGPAGPGLHPRDTGAFGTGPGVPGPQVPPGSALPGSPLPGGAPDPSAEEAGAYLDVSDRIRQLETERTSRWTRIVQMLNPGSGS